MNTVLNELKEIKTEDSLADETAETQTNDSPAEEAETSEAEESLEKTGELPEDSEENTSAEESDALDEDKTESEDKTSEEDSEEKKPRSLLSKIANRVLVAVLVLITAFTAYIMINAHHGKAVSIFGNYVLRVTTGSMEPSLHVGDYILVKKTDVNKLQKDDVISFYSEESGIKGELVTHRIVKVNTDGSFITMGDANPMADSLPVRAEQIVGKYSGKTRFFKWVNSFADMKKLIALFVILPLTLIALYEAKTVLKLSVQVKQENDEEYEQRKQELIREAIEKEKQRLAEEASGADKEKIDEPRTNNEKEND